MRSISQPPWLIALHPDTGRPLRALSALNTCLHCGESLGLAQGLDHDPVVLRGLDAGQPVGVLLHFSCAGRCFGDEWPRFIRVLGEAPACARVLQLW